METVTTTKASWFLKNSSEVERKYKKQQRKMLRTLNEILQSIHTPQTTHKHKEHISVLARKHSTKKIEHIIVMLHHNKDTIR